METAVVLFILRLVSAITLIAFMGALFWLVLRDFRSAVNQTTSQRRSYGQLVAMFEADGKLIKTGQSFPLLPLTSFGRSPTNTVPIEDNFASGEHAILTRRSDQWWLEDRRSRNGTTLNGIAFEKAVIVTNGDVIGIGKMRYRVEFEEVMQ
ncbi:MAG: FHA domain-containing protein [Anaerolineae bacterium]|nr:FHA domain-containing protein [Chloroflexota bacterium]MBP6297859.1 FHA domain-containing protein [Anaerolineae bacterium]